MSNNFTHTMAQLRYFIELSYKGTKYCGWQIQPNAITVQEILNNCLSKILNKKIKTTGSGRTDAGVHAVQQFAHFDIEVEIDCKKVVHSLNSLLPEDIVVSSIFLVTNDMHARYSATSRAYTYTIINKKNPFLSETAYFSSKIFDLALMNKAAEMLCIGPMDYKIFSKTNSGNENYLCDIQFARWQETKDGLLFEIVANRFLRGMVRIIVSYLLRVGEGSLDLETFHKILHNGMLINRPALAPEHGLALVRVAYD